MDQGGTINSQRSDVDACLFYVAPMSERAHSYTYGPPSGVPRSNTVNAAHRMTVHCARPIAADLSLDREGFELVEHRSAVRKLHNPKQHWRYVPEVRADEVLLLKCHDSARDGRAVLSPQGALEDPSTPADALPRESVELRTIAFQAT
jgi:hypothetical protein